MPDIETVQIEIDNLKCGGCAKSIVKGLSELDGVGAVVVDHEHHTVRLQPYEATQPIILEWLRGMGYPEKGSAHGVGAAVAGAKSFVSCAMGRLS